MYISMLVGHSVISDWPFVYFNVSCLIFWSAILKKCTTDQMLFLAHGWHQRERVVLHRTNRMSFTFHSKGVVHTTVLALTANVEAI